MKRFHIHIAVADLAVNVDFYRRLFEVQPSVIRNDYAKWELDDPMMNFAISSRGHEVGINHIGVQASTEEELQNLKHNAFLAASNSVHEQREATCCYAKSNKHWLIDPQGIAWEHFHTLDTLNAFGEDNRTESTACCIPMRQSEQEQELCCLPESTNAGDDSALCCG